VPQHLESSSSAVISFRLSGYGLNCYVEDIPSSVTVITKEEIKTSTARNVTEALTEVAGLRISEYGKKGALSLPRLRGSTAEQVLILLDGRRLNSPATGQFNLNDLPVSIEDIERVEILRGASSALYGADALGGVINIITRRPEESQTRVSASYGRFDSQLYSLTTSYHNGFKHGCFNFMI